MFTRRDVLRYWFLLEIDLVKALAKGNLALLDIAQARIKFLKPVVEKRLLQKCLQGEEEAVRC